MRAGIELSENPICLAQVCPELITFISTKSPWLKAYYP